METVNEPQLEVVTFEEIWDKLSVDEQLEDAFAKLMGSYSQISTVKDAYVKLTAGHSRNIRKWHLNESSFKPIEVPDELEQIAEDAKQTVDVVIVDALLKGARQIFDSIKNDTETEDTLFDHWHDLQRYIEDVNKCTRDYIMDFSIQLNDLGNKLQNEVELYKQKEDEVLFAAENALEKTISAKFKEYRLQKLKDHRTRIQQNHECEMALKLVQFREMNEQRDREMKAMDELKTQVSNLKIEFSEQPLIRLKRLAAVNDDVLKREQVLILLKAKMERINNLVEKRKKDEKQQNDFERLEQERKEKAELERIEKERKLMKRGLLIYQKNLRNDKNGKA